MKKMLFALSLVLFAVSMNAAIDYTAKVFLAIDVDPSVASNPRLTLREATNFSNAFDNGYDAANANNYGIDVYATISGQTSKNWKVWYTNELDSTKLCVRITEGTSHSIKFAGVEGTTLYLYDAQEDVYTEIKNGESYAFTIAQVGTAITDRFMIVKNLPQAEFEICFRNGHLTLTNYTGAYTVKNAEGAEVKTVTSDSAEAEYDFDMTTADAGRYSVTYTDPDSSSEKTLVFTVGLIAE